MGLKKTLTVYGAEVSGIPLDLSPVWGTHKDLLIRIDKVSGKKDKTLQQFPILKCLPCQLDRAGFEEFSLESPLLDNDNNHQDLWLLIPKRISA